MNSIAKITTLLALLVLPLTANEPYRDWTQAATGRTLKGKITEKLEDDSKAKIVTPNGKVHWLVAADLIEEDQAYIRDFMPPIEHLTVRVVGSGKGHKKLKIVVIAGREPLRFVISPSWPNRTAITRQIAAKETEEFEVSVYPEYSAQVTDPAGTVVDSEKWNEKTGL